jgi:hypothetical protein
MRIDENVGVASEVENGGFATLRLREALTRKRPVKLSFIPFSNDGERSEIMRERKAVGESGSRQCMRAQ